MKKKYARENSQILHVKPYFCPWKRKVRLKKPKKHEKYAREKQILHMFKNEERAKKGFHAHFFFTPKKKH